MRKSAFVPDFWIQSDLGDSALRTLLVLNLHRDGNNCCHISNAKIATEVNKDVRRVQDDLNRAIELGLIVRKFDDQGKRYFELILNRKADDGKRHGVTDNSIMGCRNPSWGDDAERQGGMTDSVTPPNNPLIGITYKSTYKSTYNSHEETNTHTDQNNPIEALGQKPKPISDQILRMASQIGLEGWVGEVQFQEIDPEDWRVKETLVRIKGTGKKVNGRYAWQIFNGLPEVKPPAEAVGFKTVKVDHMPNVMPPLPEKSEFSAIKTEYYNRLGDLSCDFAIINSLMEAIDAEPKQGQPSEYRNRLEAIYRDTLRLNGSHK